MSNKRYTAQAGAKLLLRLLAADPEEGRAKRLLIELLQARLSDTTIAGSVVDRLRAQTDEEIAKSVPRIRRLLSDLVVFSRIGIGFSLTVKNASITISPGTDLSIELAGPVHSMLLIQGVALGRLAREHVRRCECGTIFGAQGKRENCSPRCQKRFYMRRFRAGEAGRE